MTTVTSHDVGHTTESTFSRVSVWLMLIFMSIATASDGYNAAVIGNISLLFDVLYPGALTSTMYSRLSNAFLIGMILGMVAFGYIADQFGRKTGAVMTTIILTVGVIISAAASGKTETGMLWMLVVGRGIAGVGAGGEYPVTGAGAMEATDESSGFRKRRGFVFAIMSEVAASLGYCFGALVPLILLLANASESMIKTLGWGVIINSFYLPGPFLGGWLADKIGRRQTMTLGFVLQAVLGFILGGAYDKIQSIFPLFVVMYGIFLTLGEVGPGSTIALISAEPFPTSIRGQCNGLISAFAKVGATAGTEVFAAILTNYKHREEKGNQTVFMIGSAFALLGAVLAWFLLEDVSLNLDDEDEEWKCYLAAHGWEGTWGDNETQDPRRAVQ
ncbi:hypothetical protein NW754_014884 [Fusarium falciforme]|nr:hypothetical protein NW754_014884 [Fusarium falciforme]